MSNFAQTQQDDFERVGGGNLHDFAVEPELYCELVTMKPNQGQYKSVVYDVEVLSGEKSGSYISFFCNSVLADKLSGLMTRDDRKGSGLNYGEAVKISYLGMTAGKSGKAYKNFDVSRNRNYKGSGNVIRTQASTTTYANAPEPVYQGHPGATIAAQQPAPPSTPVAPAAPVAVKPTHWRFADGTTSLLGFDAASGQYYASNATNPSAWVDITQPNAFAQQAAQVQAPPVANQSASFGATQGTYQQPSSQDIGDDLPF